MSASILIDGKVKKHNKCNNPYQPGTVIHCVELEEGSDKITPRHLPPASPVLYNVFFNERQMNRLCKNLKSNSLIGANLHIEGEVNLDLPISLVQGDIGVVAVTILPADERTENNSEQVVNAPIVMEQKEPEKILVNIEDICVPSEFAGKSPLKKKIDEVKNYFHIKGTLGKPLYVKKTCEGFLLKDGYSRYIAAKELGIKKVEIIVNSLNVAFLHDFWLEVLIALPCHIL